MRKTLTLFISLCFATSGFAGVEYDESPTVPFSTSANMHKTVSVTWLTSPNPQATCNAEAKKRGYKDFGFSVLGCAFWTGASCTIVTKTNPNMHTLGHEIRHCFQGDWHSKNGQTK